MKKFIIFMIAMAPVVFVGCAEENEPMNEAVNETQETLNQVEQTAQNVFYDTFDYNEWDANSNNELSEDEFFEGSFAGLDENDDDMLSEQEWDRIGDYWNPFDVNDYGVFEDWDANGDGMINNEEFVNSAGELGIFEDLDANGDGILDNEEINANNSNPSM